MNKVRISASRLKTLKDCSWVYYAQYVLKIPEKHIEAMLKGSCIHSVLEYLTKPKHHKHVNSILKTSQITKVVKKFIEKKAKELKVFNTNNLQEIEEMVYTALQFDFLCKGNIKLEEEKEFEIETDVYIIKGFIDKLAVYRSGRVVVWDYKSSKSKFSKNELNYNMQSFIYSLAVKKQFGKIPQIKFLFLRYSKQPLQESPILTEKQLTGFELFLDHVAKYLRNFDRKKALAEMAYFEVDKKWLCGKEGCKENGDPHFICKYRNPFFYYALYDLDNTIIETDFEILNLEKKKKGGQQIRKIFYYGCPAWHQRILPKHFSLIKNL